MARAWAAEFLGTLMLVCTVVGSGIMADALSDDVAVSLLGNTIATGAILYVLILILGPISGAHFNPAVSLVMALRGGLAWRDLGPYVAMQVVGAILGSLVAHGMFGLDLLQFSERARSGGAQWFAEAVATAGLLFVILRSPSGKASSLVACYIGAAYWFTASTSFANPAAAFGRMFSNTFAGISPADVPAFVVAQIIGGFAGMMLHVLLKNEDH